MSFDYFVKSELVIEFLDEKRALCKTISNRSLKKEYLKDYPDKDSDDDEEFQLKKYYEELDKIIAKYIYKKPLFENNLWIKSSYEKKYIKNFKILCPNMVKIVKVYKIYTAWRRC
jgi:hypothetical protein